MDTFSNILYVKEAKRALSALAHKCVSIDVWFSVMRVSKPLMRRLKRVHPSQKWP